MCPAPPVAGYTSAPGGTLPAALPWGLKTLICRRDRLQYLAAPWAFPKGDAQFLPRRVSQGHPRLFYEPLAGHWRRVCGQTSAPCVRGPSPGFSHGQPSAAPAPSETILNSPACVQLHLSRHVSECVHLSFPGFRVG